MKTYTIKNEKAELLVVELPRLSNYTLGTRGLFVEDLKTKEGTVEKFHFIEGFYTLLGKPDEISEEDAKGLVDRDKSVMFEYKNYKGEKRFLTAKESLLSLLESEIFWDNPLGTKRNVEKIASFKSEIAGKHLIALWHEAEQKTFNRSQSIIFKNN